jgi:hypothetical protein
MPHTVCRAHENARPYAAIHASGDDGRSAPELPGFLMEVRVKASLFYLPTIASRAEIENGMAGMRADYYQRMLRELSEQIRLADDLGYDSVSFSPCRRNASA